MINHSLVTADLMNLLETRLTWPIPESNNANISTYNITFCVTVSETDSACVPDSEMTAILEASDVEDRVSDMASATIQVSLNARIRVTIIAVNMIGMGPVPDVDFFFLSFTTGECVRACVHVHACVRACLHVCVYLMCMCMVNMLFHPSS